MRPLDDRVAIVTGGGRGLGREHALLLASSGAKVVVNDLGVDADGTADQPQRPKASDSTVEVSPAEMVVTEIRDAGGEAVADSNDVSTWDGAEAMVEHARAVFGDVDILVNNAGFLRDSTLVKMSEADFDDVVRVHLKGHFAPTHFVAAYWRDQHKSGVERRRNIVHTASTSGIYANPGQVNYGPAKSAIVTLSQIAAKELSGYGVVSNCVLPGARTRLTMSSPGLPEIMEKPADGFDSWHPANVSPLVVFLSTAECPFTGETFYIQGGTVRHLSPWSIAGESVEKPTRWAVDELADAMTAFLPN